jgi:hypothetical protein
VRFLKGKVWSHGNTMTKGWVELIYY